MKAAYDLHIHSCLSPCADDDMTPANVAGMASVCGLAFAALTDHNSCGNCRAFFEACRAYPGLVPVAGAEVTTAEEIHLLGLFPSLEAAEGFEREVLGPARAKVPNRRNVFGHQWLMDAEDTRLGEVEELLVAATGLGLEEAAAAIRARGGAAVPAHVDRESNGLIAVLGDVPETPDFPVVEFRWGERVEDYKARYPRLAGKRVVCSSDAHGLAQIQEAVHEIEVEEPTAAALVAALRGQGLRQGG
jgi:hypothetical protein